MRLRASENREGCALLENAVGPDLAISIDIILKDDICDVCIDERRTLIRRLPEFHGDRLILFAEGSTVTFGNIDIRPLEKR